MQRGKLHLNACQESQGEMHVMFTLNALSPTARRIYELLLSWVSMQVDNDLTKVPDHAGMAIT